jgi:hypothetical protein
MGANVVIAFRVLCSLVDQVAAGSETMRNHMHVRMSYDSFSVGVVPSDSEA